MPLIKRNILTIIEIIYFQAINFLRKNNSPPVIIIFSKNRAMQLDLLCKSILENSSTTPRVIILWTATTEAHEKAYQEVLTRNSSIIGTALKEINFRWNLLYELKKTQESKVLFLVDDLIFLRKFDFATLESINTSTQIPSLRLGKNIEFCQPEDRFTGTPHLSVTGGNWLRFSWMSKSGDWGMPLSVDGNVFNTKEIFAILSRAEFKAPNSLESALGPYRFLFKYRRGLCLQNPVIINLAINRVQTENFHFPHGSIDTDYLLDLWNKGYEIDRKKIENMQFNSCHAIIELPMKIRT